MFCTATTEGSAEEDGGASEAGAGDGVSIGAEVGTTVGSAEVDGMLVTRSTVEVRYGAPFSLTYTTTSATVSVTYTTSVRTARFTSSLVKLVLRLLKLDCMIGDITTHGYTYLAGGMLRR